MVRTELRKIIGRDVFCVAKSDDDTYWDISFPLERLPLSDLHRILEALDATNQSIITDLETIRSGSTPATVEKLGLVRIGENLKITKDGILSVDTANAVEQDNTKPITSAAVHAAIGNIEVLLAAL